MDVQKTYNDQKFLNKTIDSNNRSEESSDYILDYYIDLNGEVPTLAYLKAQRKMMDKWLFKSKELYSHLIVALKHLSIISIDVYLEAY
jgi:hypothetical protein